MKKVLTGLGLTFVGLYCAICVGMFLMQDKLVFVPKKYSNSYFEEVKKNYKTTYYPLSLKDGTKLQGWWVRSKQPGQRPMLLYFGGNASEVSFFNRNKPHFKGMNVAFFNYPGYGQSEGKPSEKKIFEASLMIFDHFRAKKVVDTKQMYVMGYSLGSGVAAHVAAKRKVAKCILITPYDGLSTIGQYRYPYLPVEALLKHRFHTKKIANDIRGKVLIMYTPTDETIPASSTKRLIKVFKRKPKVVNLGTYTHNTVSRSPLYWKSIEAFLK